MKDKNENLIKLNTTCKQTIELFYFKGMEQEFDFCKSWVQEKLQILYIKQGKAYLDCNERQYYMQAEDLVLINPYEMFFFQSLTPDLSYYVLRFSPSFFSEIIPKECFEKYIRPVETGTLRFQNDLREDFYLQKDVKEIITEIQRKEIGYEIMMQSVLSKIITKLIRNHICTMCSKREIECIKKNQSRFLPMFEYLKDHYSEKIQVTDMADFTDVTSCHFCRMFKHISNKTFVDYLNSIRLVKSCSKLVFSNRSIKEVALICGFEDMNYFIRIFKKYYKVTPNQFRKMWTKEEKEGLKKES